MNLRLTIDGTAVETLIDPGESLMALLRRLGHTSVKNGCDHGDCGSCAVLIDGRAVTACLVFAAQMDGATITTIEGLEGPGGLHPLQFTALDEGAVQCGFCTPGMLLAALDLLGANPDPTEAEVRRALAGSYCRCTGYVKPVAAILAAAAVMRESRS
ncbi:MAG TPA: (2Fe-2S)-binding protein [Acidimicrobiia bacterium]|nr:(2Fe-2S)-binding protein [Acidimicrobiia bacterium]